MSPTNVGHNQHLSSVAPRWAAILAPFFEEIHRQQTLVANEAVARALAQQVNEAAEKEKNEELLNDQQAAELLGVKRKTVFSWKQKGLLPSHRLGGRIFYKRGEVLAALEASTQPDGRRKYARRGKPNEQGR
jgi:excisionase family DNA binding protein